MKRKRAHRGLIWYIGEGAFRKIIRESSSYADISRRLSISHTGSRPQAIRDRCDELGIPMSERLQGPPVQRSSRRVPSEDVLVENSPFSRSTAKLRIHEERLLDEKCAICGVGTTWHGKPLVLRLDHINGVNDDHRIENLRFVCPNCDSQLETFCARNQERPVRENVPCSDCGVAVTDKHTLRCVPCNGRLRHERKLVKRAIDWPPVEELKARISATNQSTVARELGVSDTAVRKMLRRMEKFAA